MRTRLAGPGREPSAAWGRSLGAAGLLMLVSAACGAPEGSGDGGAFVEMDGAAGPDAGPTDPCELDPASCAAPRCEDDPCPPEERCVMDGPDVQCLCPAGTERVGERCEPVDGCQPSTCDGHGACTSTAEGVECACDVGYSGERCESCAADHVRNPAGDCVTDLCQPNPCDEPERRRCEVVDGAPVCRCNAGTHDEGGVCVQDTTCTESTCSGRGTCSEADGVVECACDPGVSGPFCGACDEASGYHDDGMGGCTTDPCLPNPCTSALQTVCTVGSEGAAVCECDAGAHREGDECVPDEICTSDTCGAGGSCVVEGGVTRCECMVGWGSERCETCASGYHDDGAGGCTDDPCLPNPCTEPGRGVCVAGGASASCECDPGLHEDGVGGCTDDPCLPDPCAELGQACRAVSGAAECYTPDCDDGDPCTDDALIDAECVYTYRGDGASCSTTVCATGQTCQAGSCGGGAEVTCDDGNPCTRDVCDAVEGCRFTEDDSLEPDDGVGCTVDGCEAGVASHLPDDGRCDDGSFCNGAETCDASQGCLSGPAPRRPASTPCHSFGACDEDADEFPETILEAGASCDDGLSCTGGDTCQSRGGPCVGEVLASCPYGESCAEADTTPLSAAVDVPVARLTGAVTVDSAPAPSSLTRSYERGFSLILQHQQTEQRHYIGGAVYTGSGSYLSEGTDVIDAILVPGVYDLIFERDHDDGDTNTWPYVRREANPSELPNGYATLRQGVVLGAGEQTLDVDVPVTRLTGAVSVDSMALPASLDRAYERGFSLILQHRQTGARHYIGGAAYTGSGSDLTAGSDAVDAVLVPGTYDLIYERDHDDGDANTWSYVRREPNPSELPNGYALLASGVVLQPGEQTLDVDVPVTRLSGAVTLDGAPLPGSLAGSYERGFSLILRHTVTSERHYVGGATYTGSGSFLAEGSDVVDAVLVPGTYDLIYERDHVDGDENSWPYVRQETNPSELPNGYAVLRRGVTLAPGEQTLDVDIAPARLTGEVTLEGSPLPTSLARSYERGFSLILVHRETRQAHYVGGAVYTGSSSTLSAGSDRVDAVLVPGEYDLVYERDHDDGDVNSWPYVRQETNPSELPNGYVVLREGVTVTAGEQTLDVDVPVTRLSGAVTIDGEPAPSSLPRSYERGFSLVLRHRATGQAHYVGGAIYTGSSSTLSPGSDRVDAALVPGVYDLIYEREHDDGDANTWPFVRREPSPFELPSGYAVLREGVVLNAGAQTLDVDVPVARLQGPVTLESRPLPDSLERSYERGLSLVLIARETRQAHYIGGAVYTGSASLLADGSDEVSAVVVPGVYDLIYERDHDDGDANAWPYVAREWHPSALPNGYALLRSCVAVP